MKLYKVLVAFSGLVREEPVHLLPMVGIIIPTVDPVVMDTPNQDLKYFTKIAKSLGMAALIEVHTYEEMERVLKLEDVELLGINNRDLGTFKVDLNITVDLLAGPLGDEVRERGITMVGESGIFTIDDVNVLQEAGVGCLLVGESLVKQDTPDVGIKKLYGRPLE